MTKRIEISFPRHFRLYIIPQSNNQSPNPPVSYVFITDDCDLHTAKHSTAAENAETKRPRITTIALPEYTKEILSSSQKKKTVTIIITTKTSIQKSKMGKSILLINGPNLNLLGTREPHIYGSTTLADVEASSKSHAASLGASLESFQSNHEGAIVDRIQAARGRVDGIVINPGAYTHTSVAIRDALLGVSIPFIELHVSNVHAREPWRHHSYFSDKAAGIIVGLGVHGYKVAVEHVALNFEERQKETKAAL